MSEPIHLADFSNTDLIDLRYHLDPENHDSDYIEMEVRDRDGRRRVIRFDQVSNLCIDEGFSGYLGGMSVSDISARQWSHARVEVQNVEQDPGVTFLAQSMAVVVDEIDS